MKIFRLLACFLLALSITSCLSERSVTRWNNRHFEVAAKYCARAFPVLPVDSSQTTTLDSSAYLQSIGELRQWVGHLNQINDSLIYVLVAQDTACQKYAPIVRYLRGENEKLNARLNTIKPVREVVEKKVTVKDSASLALLTGEIARLNGALQAAEDLIEADKKLITAQDNLIASLRGWMIKLGLLVLALGAWIFRKPLLRMIGAFLKPWTALLPK